jgi:Tfp pilus assembly protein PilO
MNKSFTIPILFFVGLLLIVYIILPEFYNFRNLKKELEIKNQEIESIENYHKKITAASDKLKDYEESLLKINSALPDDYSAPSLFNYLQKTSAENGLFLKSVGLAMAPVKRVESSPEAQTSKQGVEERYVNINLIGSYDSFKTFLKAIEKSSRMIETENILIKIDEGILNFILLLKVSSYH